MNFDNLVVHIYHRQSIFYYRRDSASYRIFYGEFDPGSGLTLAECLTHASRAAAGVVYYLPASGGRLSNAWERAPK